MLARPTLGSMADTGPADAGQYRRRWAVSPMLARPTLGSIADAGQYRRRWAVSPTLARPTLGNTAVVGCTFCGTSRN